MVMRLFAFAAVVSAASAFSPFMTLDVGRRQIIQTGAGAAITTPFFTSLPASATRTVKPPKPPAVIHPWQTSKAPYIAIFNHVGCQRENTEYTGAKSNTEDDERCVMVASKLVKWEEPLVEKFNRDRVAAYGARYQDLVVTGYNGKYTPRKVGEGLIHPEDSDYCKAGGSDCASAIETAKKEEAVRAEYFRKKAAAAAAAAAGGVASTK